MRCPKCGYISFDHVDTCLRCNKDITGASKVEGTTYNVAPPAFLKFTKRDQPVEEKNELSFDADDDDFGVVDPDLDVLVDDENEADGEGISFDDGLDGFDAFAEEESFEVDAAAEDDDDDSGLDLGQFEDAFEDEVQEPGGGDLDIDIPEELSDISDLSAPAEAAPEPALAPAVEEEQDEFDDLNLDLDMDDLNDDFNLTAEADDGGEKLEEEALADLSLDDLGLSEGEDEVIAAEQPEEAEKDEMDMDADLDFDLDLGGISLDDEDGKKK